MFVVHRTQRVSQNDLILKMSFVALFYIDLALTLLAVQNGFAERNPVMAGLIHMPALLLLVKVVVPAVIAWLIPGKFLLPSVVFMLFVTAWNVQQLLLVL